MIPKMDTYGHSGGVESPGAGWFRSIGWRHERANGLTCEHWAATRGRSDGDP